MLSFTPAIFAGVSPDSPDIPARLSLFAENAQAIRKEFTWQNALTKRLSALLYAQADRRVDCDAIRWCLDLMKQNTGVFSTFRGNMALSVATLLSLSPDPAALFQQTLAVYELLRATKLRNSDYLVVAAYQIAAQTEPDHYRFVVDRTRAFYDGMRAKHFLQTGQDDYIFAAMLALSALDPVVGTDRIERLVDRLRADFRDKNSIQALAQVLALSGTDESATIRITAIRDALRTHKIKLDRAFTLPSLGILALMPGDPGVIAREIDQAQAYLRAQKGFGPLSATTPELLLYATGIVADSYARALDAGVLTATISTSITNLIIAQQTATIAATSATGGAGAAL